MPDLLWSGAWDESGDVLPDSGPRSLELRGVHKGPQHQIQCHGPRGRHAAASTAGVTWERHLGVQLASSVAVAVIASFIRLIFLHLCRCHGILWALLVNFDLKKRAGLNSAIDGTVCTSRRRARMTSCP